MQSLSTGGPERSAKEDDYPFSAMPRVSPQLFWDLKREMILPITIDVENGGVRLVDTILWDIHQQVRRFHRQVVVFIARKVVIASLSFLTQIRLYATRNIALMKVKVICNDIP